MQIPSLRDVLDISAKIAIPVVIFVIGHDFKVSTANHDYLKQGISIATSTHAKREEIYATYHAYLSQVKERHAEENWINRTISAVYDPNPIRQETLDALVLISQAAYRQREPEMAPPPPPPPPNTPATGNLANKVVLSPLDRRQELRDQRSASVSASKAQQLTDTVLARNPPRDGDARPRAILYVHSCGGEQTAFAKDLVAWIDAHKFGEVRVIPHGPDDVGKKFGRDICPDQTDIRFFDVGAKDAAEGIAREIRDSGLLDDVQVKSLADSFGSRVPYKLQFELWLSADT